MRKKQKNILVFLFVLIIAGLLPTGNLLFAQDDVATAIQAYKTFIEGNRATIIANVMQLSEQQAELFWPLYKEHRLAVDKLIDRSITLLRDYGENYENLSDEKAEEILDELLAIDKERLKIKSRYVAKFRKILPPKKVLTYFQADNKMDVSVLYQVEDLIPLAEEPETDK